MGLASALESLGGGRSDEPVVVLRLCIMTTDDATGQPRLVSSFLRRSSMPPMLANPSVNIALELQGERRVCKPTHVTWDEANNVCIVEVEWLVAEAGLAEEIEEAASWSA
jgi:hypothetical protein